MPNIGSLLKSEIVRLARKEMRGEISPLRKANAQYRSEIASLKRRAQALEGLVRKLSKSAPAAQSAKSEEEVRRRFSAKGLANHRKKLGLSAEAFGQLVGVSGQTIYKWEEGKTHPRASQLEGIAGVRGLGKREALRKLEEIAATRQSSKKPARKGAAGARAAAAAPRRRRAAAA